MKTIQYITYALLTTGILTTKAMSQNETKQSSTLQGLPAKGMLRHVVLFRFKDTASPARIREVEDAFSALPSKINTIAGYEWGTNISPENLAQGFTHCFIVTFRDAAGRDFYLPHPAHKEFGKVLAPYLDKVLVIDFIDQSQK